MATYFIGTGLESFVHSATLVSDANDGLGVVISSPGGVGVADAYLVDSATGLRTPQKSLWFHTIHNGTALGGPIVTFYNSENQAVFRLLGTNEFGVTQPQRFTNGAWVNFGISAYGQNAPMTFDIRLVSHPTAGRISVNCNGTALANLEGIDTADFGSIAYARFQCGTYESTFTQTIIASYNTIGHTVRRRAPIADSSNTGWAGTYADVDEVRNNDTDAINTSIVGADITFDGTVLGPTATGNVIKAVGVSVRIRNDGGDVPRNAAALLKIDGTLYAKPNNFVVGPGFAGTTAVFEKNPRTGKAWASIAEINQPFGLRATE